MEQPRRPPTKVRFGDARVESASCNAQLPIPGSSPAERVEERGHVGSSWLGQAFRNRIASQTQIPLKAAKKSARPPVIIAPSQIPVTESIRASMGAFDR